MSRPFSQVIVLAEDRRHQRFVARYLKRSKYKGEIRLENLPSGRGCGEQWVRENYARAVGAYRARSKRTKTALIVVIDADKGDLNRRVRQLSDGLGSDPRQEDEAILHFIPRRHVETWILHLTGKAVDERSDYHNRDVDDLIPNAANTFHDWTTKTPTDCLPSVRAAIHETKRLS